MKKLMSILPLAALTISGQSFATDYQRLQQQLDIMSNIIKSSVTKSDNPGRITDIDSMYLEKQGVVFTIDSNFGRHRWTRFVIPDVAPVAPVAPGDFEVNVDFDDHIDDLVDSAMAEAEHGYERAADEREKAREEMRELKEQHRDLAYQLRDIERETRDISFQLPRADKEAKKELQEQEKQLEQHKAELAKSKEQIAAQLKKLQQEKKQQSEKQRQQKVAYFEGLGNTVAEALCLYGNGLKALPKNEHVSLVLTGAALGDDNKWRDKVYVFKKQDILDCSGEKITVTKMLAAANSYSF